MLDSSLATLRQKTLRDPYQRLAGAILARYDKMRFEICDLPKGFDEFGPNLCSEHAISEMFGSG
jgi:hypothetical protein